MHVVECTIRPKNGDIEKACEWWKKIVSMKGAWKNGQALSRLDGEQNVIIFRYTLENFVEEQEFWDNWMDTDALRYAQETWKEYAEGSPTFHRYNVLHSY